MKKEMLSSPLTWKQVTGLVSLKCCVKLACVPDTETKWNTSDTGHMSVDNENGIFFD